MQFNDIPVAQLLEYLCFLVYFIDQVGSREVLTDVDRLNGNQFFRFLVLRSVHFPEPVFT